MTTDINLISLFTPKTFAITFARKNVNIYLKDGFIWFIIDTHNLTNVLNFNAYTFRTDFIAKSF